jgi:hypothetical protein
MNWNSTKNAEKPRGYDQNKDLTEGDRESDCGDIKHKNNPIKVAKQVALLNTTLNHMLTTSRASTMSVDVALTGFYNEISKSIKRY